MAQETRSFRNVVLEFLEQHEMEVSNDQFEHLLELCHDGRSWRLETFVFVVHGAFSIPQDVVIQLHARLNAPESAISVEEDSSLSTNEESKGSEPGFHIEGINQHLRQNVLGDGPLTNPPQGQHAALGSSGNSASASNPQQQEALELFEETSRTSQLAGEEFASNESSLLQYSHTTSKSSGGNPQM
jgi:hypothetical protein